MIVSAIFYVVAVIISFLAYREFKGILYDNGMGQGGGLGGLMAGRSSSMAGGPPS